MPGDVLIVGEHRDDVLAVATREAIGFGRRLAERLGGSASLLLVGAGAGLAGELSRAEELEVVHVDTEACRVYTPEVHAAAIAEVVRQRAPVLVLMAHTYQGIDLAPRLATVLGCGLVARCIDGEVRDGRVVFWRPVYGGKLHQEIAPRGAPPHLVTLQPGAHGVDPPRAGAAARVVSARVEAPDGPWSRRVLEVLPAPRDGVDLSRAEIVVAGGRGLGSKENFQLIVELARVLGGAVGATRPVVDAGWVPREHQIGVSGQSVAPRLYLACGLSGAHQHLVGMQAARCVIAINSDAQAPIFDRADYGIVGDVLRVLPTLIETARALRERKE
ncbi:MAG TPA: electron transfer flavoprotein subunit alpha/FixB family protein [Candidatus Polarisedimenticolaceae bacterium]|nr:electron transfer flavoprotein subunit alpha/FixB family protein [Candidatus Polarisedimenticolaceae bacterium]